LANRNSYLITFSLEVTKLRVTIVRLDNIMKFVNWVAHDLTKLIPLNTLLLLTIYSHSPPAHAQNGWQAVTEVFPPYNFIKDGKSAGYATELVERVASNLNLKLQIQFVPWPRAMLRAETEKNILIYSILRTNEREHRYYWVGELDDISLYVWQLKDQDVISARNKTDFTYGIVRSLDDINISFLTQKLQVSNDDVISVDKGSQLIGLLLKQRVDRIVMAENMWRRLRKNLSSRQQSKLERYMLLARKSIYLAASLKSDPKDLQLFRDAFNKVIKNSDVEVLKSKYGID